jgi:hypothetical protein
MGFFVIDEDGFYLNYAPLFIRFFSTGSAADDQL